MSYVYSLFNFDLVHQVIPALDSHTPIFASSFTMEVRISLFIVLLLCWQHAAFHKFCHVNQQ